MTRTEPGTQAQLVQLVVMTAIRGVPEEEQAFKKVDLLTLTLNLARDFQQQQKKHRDKALNDP
jgi:hypothetical protein